VTSQPPPSAAVVVSQTQPASKPVNDNVRVDVHESTDVKAFTDPHADDLLAQPSPLADSLFHLWAMPQDVANSLLKIYTNPYLLTVSNEAQLQEAFSTASPDDIVQNTQLRGKINPPNPRGNNSSGTRSSQQLVVQEQDVGKLALDIHSVDLNNETSDVESPISRQSLTKKTLEDIKELLYKQEGSCVSFVIIGT
jgi:hypothetical protein